MLCHSKRIQKGSVTRKNDNDYNNNYDGDDTELESFNFKNAHKITQQKVVKLYKPLCLINDCLHSSISVS